MGRRWLLGAVVALVLTSGTARAAEPVAEWAGSGARDTETFTITSDTWNVRWAGTLAGPGRLSIQVRRADGELVALAANQMAPAAIEGSSVQRGAGTYYLRISGHSVGWTIAVEELP